MTPTETLIIKLTAVGLLILIMMTTGCTVVSSSDPSWQWPADLEI